MSVYYDKKTYESYSNKKRSSFLMLHLLNYLTCLTLHYPFQSELNIKQFFVFYFLYEVYCSPSNIPASVLSSNMTLKGDPSAAEIRIYNVLLVTSCSCFLCFCVGCIGPCCIWTLLFRSVFLKDVFMYLFIICSLLKHSLYKTLALISAL